MVSLLNSKTMENESGLLPSQAKVFGPFFKKNLDSNENPPTFLTRDLIISLTSPAPQYEKTIYNEL
jgi:hypothetical protein